MSFMFILSHFHLKSWHVIFHYLLLYVFTLVSLRSFLTCKCGVYFLSYLNTSRWHVPLWFYQSMYYFQLVWLLSWYTRTHRSYFTFIFHHLHAECLTLSSETDVWIPNDRQSRKKTRLRWKEKKRKIPAYKNINKAKFLPLTIKRKME